MHAYEVSKVPARVWDRVSTGERIRHEEFNVAAWVQMTGPATRIQLMIEHDDEAGHHEAVVDRANTPGDGSLLMSGMVHLAFTGTVGKVRVVLLIDSAESGFRVDELYVQRRGQSLSRDDKLISNF